MAEENSSLNDSDVILIQQPEVNEEVDVVVDLLAEDDFDAVFNDSSTWDPETDHSGGAQSNGKSDSLGVKSEVSATGVNIAVTNRDSAATTTSGKRKADDRVTVNLSRKSTNLRKKSRVSDPSSSSLVAVTDLSAEDANSDNEIDCASKPGKTNTILKRIGISDIDSYERKQRRSNRIEKAETY